MNFSWSKHVGTVETEAFTYYIRSQSFDYTQRQQEHYDTMTPEAIYQSIEKHSADHPFQGKSPLLFTKTGTVRPGEGDGYSGTVPQFREPRQSIKPTPKGLRKRVSDFTTAAIC